MLRAISTRWLWTNLVTLPSMTSVSSPSDLALICQMRQSVKAWTSFLPAEWPYPLILTGEPKDALHQLRTRVCSLLVIVRGYMVLRPGDWDQGWCSGVSIPCRWKIAKTTMPCFFFAISIIYLCFGKWYFHHLNKFLAGWENFSSRNQKSIHCDFAF